MLQGYVALKLSRVLSLLSSLRRLQFCRGARANERGSRQKNGKKAVKDFHAVCARSPFFLAPTTSKHLFMSLSGRRSLFPRVSPSCAPFFLALTSSKRLPTPTLKQHRKVAFSCGPVKVNAF